ncbi:hypothetical protein F0562_027177 [Nyssa sinensis]|uniref:Major facilitator superfamily (MFS) profile domain-containing protein n=1 Tax=Nyssa sinensis TaxID=561372 RepID=A0A5J5B4A7_9ASTE|nr:hypothetical protein F0562_027177 [Nyssa sinensis]
MVLLTVSASIDSLRPPKCTARPCIPASNGQTAFLYGALALIALGTGGIKPCVSSFGADQFDEADEKEVVKKYSFFNWFFFAINMGALFGITLIVYLQQQKGWTWGFAVPTAAMFCSIIILAAGIPYYRYQKPMGSAFTRFLQVIVASVRNHSRGVEVGRGIDLYELKTKESDIFGARKLAHTAQYRFLDKAAVISDPEEADKKNRWNLCTVTQVEEFKSFIRVLPVWASTIALSISFSQLSTFFISQATIMDRKLGQNFVIPAGSVPVFAAVNALFLVPIYEKWIVPILRRKTGQRRGISSLQRMGVGLFVSIFALTSAALVEKKRRDHSKPSSMSVFWLFPQFFLMGSAEVFTYVGQLEFFYDESTDGTRSISSAMFLSEFGIGSWLSTAIVKIIERATGGVEKGWLRNSLNKSRLDYFYWILTAINGANFLIYLWVALRYKGRDGAGGNVRDDAMVELGGQERQEVDKGEFQIDENATITEIKDYPMNSSIYPKPSHHFVFVGFAYQPNNRKKAPARPPEVEVVTMFFATIMDRKLGQNFVIPAGSVTVFAAVNALFLVPIYEKWIVPILRRKTGQRRGISSLQRMGVGLFVSIFALTSAALVEKKRRDHSKPSSMSVFWLFPQFFLMGSAEVFTYVGQLEFFYDESTDGTRSISSAMFLSEFGIGSWLSTAIVKIIERATGGVEKGWLRNSLNKSRLDYFYWILTAINGVNFLIYLWVALRYKGRDGAGGNVRDDAMVELGGQERQEVDKGEFQSTIC